MILVLGLISCSKEKSAAAAGNENAKNSPVVATIGNEKITDADIDALLSQIPEQARARYDSPEGRRGFVSELTEIKMLALAAKKKGLDKDPDMKIKLDFVYDQILARGLAESALDQIKISEEEISKYYTENKDKFNAGARVKLRHILVGSEDEAKTILTQLKKGGDFSKLATEKSKCPSSKQGGDLGWATKGMMVPEFEKVAFALKKGQMSDIVKTSFGYHIIMCDDSETGKLMDLSEAKGAIEQQLRNERSGDAVKTLIEQVKKDFPVTINEEHFKKAQEGAAKNMPVPGSGLPPALPAQSSDAQDSQ